MRGRWSHWSAAKQLGNDGWYSAHLLLFLQSEIPVHKIMLPTFTVVFLSSVKALWDCPPRHTQRCVSMVIPNPLNRQWRLTVTDAYFFLSGKSFPLPVSIGCYWMWSWEEMHPFLSHSELTPRGPWRESPYKNRVTKYQLLLVTALARHFGGSLEQMGEAFIYHFSVCVGECSWVLTSLHFWDELYECWRNSLLYPSNFRKVPKQKLTGKFRCFGFVC